MADVRAFRGLRFDATLVDSLGELICPPYDVISPQEQRALSDRNSHNVVRLELPAAQPGQDRYAGAANLLLQWRDGNVLRRDELPSMYVVRRRFCHAGTSYERCELTACVRLEKWEQGSVLPHELTEAAPKEDRLALMKACQANFSPIMALYGAPSDQVNGIIAGVQRSWPDLEFQTNDGHSYTLWVIQDAEALEMIRQALARKPLYLADGHHRYETALTYRDHRRQEDSNGSPDAAYNFALMTLVSLDDPGLLVLPYHRLVGNLDLTTLGRVRDRLAEIFCIQTVSKEARDPTAMEELVRRQGHSAMTVGMLGSGGEGPYLLTLRRPHEVERLLPRDARILRHVEAWVIHELVLRSVLGDDLERYTGFSHDASDAWSGTCNGKHQMAFFLRPFPLDLFQEVVNVGVRLPPKSTYFHPKLPTGLVINPLDGEL